MLFIFSTAFFNHIKKQFSNVFSKNISKATRTNEHLKPSNKTRPCLLVLNGSPFVLPQPVALDQDYLDHGSWHVAWDLALEQSLRGFPRVELRNLHRPTAANHWSLSSQSLTMDLMAVGDFHRVELRNLHRPTAIQWNLSSQSLALDLAAVGDLQGPPMGLGDLRGLAMGVGPQAACPSSLDVEPGHAVETATVTLMYNNDL